MNALHGRAVLLVVSGGISAYKAPLLVRALQSAGAVVRCVLSRNATHFVAPLALETLTQQPVAIDMFDAGTRIEHLELARWAEIVLVAPATAHLLARLAHGLADDLVSTLMLAVKAPVVLAPAMNCDMLAHPATQRNIETLRSFGHSIVEPEEGELACKVQGKGRQPDPEVLIEALLCRLEDPVLQGQHVIVTAGATREYLDPVRFLSNPSTGKMGVALARAAARAGARVSLLAGVGVEQPVGLPSLELLRFESVAQLEQALFARLDDAQWLWMAAAVGDWQATEVLSNKRKKRYRPEIEGGEAEPWTVELRASPDLLRNACLQRQRSGRERALHIIGFAAETEALESHARSKLERKGCELILANWVRSEHGDSFGADDVCLDAYTHQGRIARFGPASKAQVARELILDFERRSRSQAWPP